MSQPPPSFASRPPSQPQQPFPGQNPPPGTFSPNPAQRPPFVPGQNPARPPFHPPGGPLSNPNSHPGSNSASPSIRPPHLQRPGSAIGSPAFPSPSLPGQPPRPLAPSSSNPNLPASTPTLSSSRPPAPSVRPFPGGPGSPYPGQPPNPAAHPAMGPAPQHPGAPHPGAPHPVNQPHRPGSVPPQSGPTPPPGQFAPHGHPGQSSSPFSGPVGRPPGFPQLGRPPIIQPGGPHPPGAGPLSHHPVSSPVEQLAPQFGAMNLTPQIPPPASGKPKHKRVYAENEGQAAAPGFTPGQPPAPSPGHPAGAPGGGYPRPLSMNEPGPQPQAHPSHPHAQSHTQSQPPPFFQGSGPFPGASYTPKQPMLPTQSGAQPHANGAAPASRSRIDPNQIPSPVVVQEADQEAYADKPYLTLSKTVPPLPSTQFGAIDEGNCNPRAIRLTTYNLPCSDELQNMSSLPLGLIVQPMVDFSPVEMPIPVVDCGEAGPVRCKRCMAYINPFCKFIEGGRKFVCNLCTFETEVPAEYFSNLDMMGRRVDLAQRPELRYGSVEFTASKDYIARPPVPLSYVFAIDVSWSSHSSGLLARCAQSIKELLYGEPPVGVVSGRRGLPPGTKVGFLTFDRSVHFYNLKANLDHPQMLVVPDINEIFVPLNDGFLVDPNESRRPIEALLDSLPSLFQPSRLAETATGAAIQAAFLALKKTGGKLSIFQTCLPTFGPGALKVREEARVLGTDKERQLYEPQEYFWKKMGQDCATAGINVDFYLFPHAYIDVATLSTLSSLTGGDTYSYHNFEAARDGLKFGNDLKRNLLRSFAYDALLRIRCSNGLKLVDYFGNFYMKNATDVELAGIDSEKSIGVLIKHDGKLDEKVESSFQCALLYTNVFGERRLRIHNISVPNTTILGNVFRFAEMDTTLNYLAKAAVAQCMHTTLKAVRDQLTEKCVKILSAYRKHCASSTAAGQLILPESFKLYPLYALTLLKTQAFRGGPDMSTDLRVHHMKALRSMGLAETAPFFYPRMFAIHQGLHENVFQPGRRFVLPPGIRVSLERLESTGAYLVENGQQMMIWLGSNISPAFLKDVFGIDSLANIDIRLRELPRLDNDTSRKLHEAIVFVQSSRARFMQLQIVRQNMDPFLEAEFANMMVEDKNHDAMNYVDFLCYVHRNIQMEISNS